MESKDKDKRISELEQKLEKSRKEMKDTIIMADWKKLNLSAELEKKEKLIKTQKQEIETLKDLNKDRYSKLVWDPSQKLVQEIEYVLEPQMSAETIDKESMI